MKLNLGCGGQVVNGWVNVDCSMGARLAKLPLFPMVNKKLRFTNLDWDKRIAIHDLGKRFPWPDSSVDAVYSSHTLEHFSKEDGRAFLQECHRVLRRSGTIRIVVPDLEASVTAYVKGRVRADDFVAGLGVLALNSDTGLKKRPAPFFRFPHKCMYDTQRLLEILDEVGFTASGRAAFDSDIDDIADIELEDRTANAVIVEGWKR